MKTFKRISRWISVLGCAALITRGTSAPKDVVAVKFNPFVREYCHVLRFPSGWQMPKVFRNNSGEQYFPPAFGLDGDYEFRVRGLLSTRFLVRGVERIGNEYYTSNLYEADFSDAAAVAHFASEEEWNAATVITVPRQTWANGVRSPSRSAKYVEFQGLRFSRSGDNGGGASLSPDRALLVVMGWTGKLAPSAGSDVPGDFSIGSKFGRSHGKLFFDIYNADTANKLVTVTATFVGIFPQEVFRKTAWVTERYFLIPLDDRRERCLVCEFGRKRQ